MTIFKSLLAATTILSLAGTGCVLKDGPDNGAIEQAIPTSDQVQIKMPAQDRVVGQLAQYYVITHDATTTFNGGAAWVLVLIHSIVEQPVTSVNGNVYTWGPGSQPLDPADYKLDVTANADGTYDYSLQGRSKSTPSAPFQAVISGHADPTPGELQGNGEFLLDFDAAKAVNPVDNADNKGQVDVHYDLAARHLDLHIMSTDASGAPVAADYAYDQDTSGGGNMTFDVQANAGGTAALEDVTMRSRWLATGEGRGDFRIAGGDLGTEQAIGSQCWSTLFLESYYTDNVNFLPTEGDPASCAFATADLPPAH